MSREALGRFAIYSAVCLCGLLTVFFPTISSGFRVMQVDAGDTLLNHYFLEHSFRWISDSEYIGSLWSPAFMFPHREVLAFSDNLFGAAPVYWLFRAVASPTLSYQLWMMVVVALDFASFGFLARKLGAGPVLASVTAFIFAFGMPRAVQLGHQQLLPQFYTPLALAYVWEFTQKPSAKALSLALLFVYLQVMAGIYLGWFLIFSLALFLPIVVLLSPGLSARAIALARESRAAQLAAVAWLIVMAGSLAPYLRAQAKVGNRAFDEVDTLLPRFGSWFLPHDGSIYSSVLPDGAAIPMVHEHWLFAGVTLWGLSAVALYAGAGNGSWIAKQHKPFFWASGLTFVAIVFLSLRWPGGFSMWPGIFDNVPGAGAIRGVSRISLIVYFYALLFGVIGAKHLLPKLTLSPRSRMAFGALLMVFCVGEQTLRGVPRFETEPFLTGVSDIESLLTAECDFAYVTHPTALQSKLQITAMWAGIQANVPVINGYSGNYPRGFPNPAQSVREITDWLKLNRSDLAGNLCVILPAEIELDGPYRNLATSPLGKWHSRLLEVR